MIAFIICPLFGSLEMIYVLRLMTYMICQIVCPPMFLRDSIFCIMVDFLLHRLVAGAINYCAIEVARYILKLTVPYTGNR